MYLGLFVRLEMPLPRVPFFDTFKTQDIPMKKQKQPETFFFQKTIEIPIYYGHFIIIFSDNQNRDKVAKVMNIDPERIGYLYGQTYHNFLYKGKESFCVVFNFWTEDPITIGTITHEVNHAGNRIMQSREFEPDFENDEAECYLKGWLADEVQQFMVKCGLV
jgi:hypothetical protein